MKMFKDDAPAGVLPCGDQELFTGPSRLSELGVGKNGSRRWKGSKDGCCKEGPSGGY